MADKIHISLDVETFGKRAGCDGRSIGAIVFNPYKRLDLINNLPYTDPAMIGKSFYLAVDNPLTTYSVRGVGDGFSEIQLAKLHGEHRKYNLFRDEETVNWWYHPDQAEAAKAFDNPVDLKDALNLFSHWLGELGVDPKNDNCCIWSHGAAYDPPIVEAWYYAVDLPVPWFYRAPRDTRTAFDMAAVGSHSQWLGRHQQGTKHHALDDASTQAKAINEAFRRLAF